MHNQILFDTRYFTSDLEDTSAAGVGEEADNGLDNGLDNGFLKQRKRMMGDCVVAWEWRDSGGVGLGEPIYSRAFRV